MFPGAGWAEERERERRGKSESRTKIRRAKNAPRCEESERRALTHSSFSRRSTARTDRLSRVSRVLISPPATRNFRASRRGYSSFAYSRFLFSVLQIPQTKAAGIILALIATTGGEARPGRSRCGIYVVGRSYH